ncbi:MAG: hypothetical protein ACLQAR_05305 [Steroidobacteraceae bacterium]
MKTILRMLLPIAALAAVSGCNTTPLTTQLQPQAVQYALQRARFEMNCPSATAQVLSSDNIQPVLNGPMMMGTERAQYTIGVTGCGSRSELVVICAQDSSGCVAAEGR